LPGFTRLRSARMPSTISLCDNVASISITGASTATGIPCLVISDLLALCYPVKQSR
jgi:hypothetical protein